MSRLLSSVLAVLFIALASVGCQRKDLMDPHDHHNLVIKAKLDDHALSQLQTIDNDGYSNPGEPKTTKYIVYEKSTKKIVTSGSFNGLQGGAYLEEGIYDLMVYTSDFFMYDANFYRSMSSKEEAEAYTRQSEINDVTPRNGVTEVYMVEPDPTFAAYHEEILILQGDNQVLDIELVQKSFKYYLTIKAKGLNKIHTATMYISGMYTTAYLTHEEHRMNEAGTQTVELDINRYDLEDPQGYGELYGEFWSFGPNQREDISNSITLYFINGDVITMKLNDLTGQIKKLTRGGEIIVEEFLEIKGPGGGFDPGVGEWNDTNVDLEL